MSPARSLSMFKAEKSVEGNSRLLLLMSFYLLFDDQAALILERNKDTLPTLYSAYVAAKKTYPEVDIEHVDSYVVPLSDFDELKKAYGSYRRLELESKIQNKRILHREIEKLMEQKNITKYRIYRDLHLNPGNTNDFIKNQRMSKMSEKNVGRIRDYCLSR